MKQLRVLVIDDSSIMRKMIVRCLKLAGIEIGELVEAADGREALEAVRKHKLDLILSDINMPEMDGLQFLQGLKLIQSAKGTPVVMITTEGTESRVVEALSAGAQAYIRKPFTSDEVKERIMPLVENLA